MTQELKALKLHFAADPEKDMRDILKAFFSTYGQYSFEGCDVVVALGGDGFMLHMLHQALEVKKPVFGLNFGSVGFLMNPYDESALLKRIHESNPVTIYPLKMVAYQQDKKESPFVYYALNEVSLLREEHQAAKIRISIDESMRLEQLVCDGILVSTPAGSTAYNFSAAGPILPITSNLLALTPISPFRPRRWRGALLPEDVTVKFEVLEAQKRPVSVSADFQEVRGIEVVTIEQDKTRPVTLLYDSHQTLGDRIIAEQFAP